MSTSIYEKFPPGSVVLAKLKGYPAWPSMVISPEKIPKPILEAKPTRLANRKRTRQASPYEEDMLCTRFFQDDNYMWCSPADILELTKDEIDTFLNKPRITNKILFWAYQLASDPPSLDDFVKYGSYKQGDDEDPDFDVVEGGEAGTSDMVEVDDEDDDVESLDTEDEPPRRRSRARAATKTATKPARTTRARSTRDKSKVTKPTSKRSTKSKTAKATKARSKRQAPPPPPPPKKKPAKPPAPKFDSDWGIEEGNDSPEGLEEYLEVIENVPSAPALVKQTATLRPQLLKIRVTLQKNFLGDTPPHNQDVKACLDKLQRLSASLGGLLPPNLIRSTNLHRVAGAIVHHGLADKRTISRLTKQLAL
ncbi:hypothetical protein LJB42_004000 [Komagataella kurtzmanii]|nr:hypothetical protein LJB42_004000 [Komagataella kurtzmanii]